MERKTLSETPASTTDMLNNTRIFDKKDLGNFFQNVSKEYTVFIPFQHDKSFFFQKLNKNKFKLTEYSNLSVPPGKLFCFNPIWQNFVDFPVETVNLEEGEKAILFGVRPCDAHSLSLLDLAIQDNDYYNERRNNILLFVVGCNFPQSNCFCTSMGGSPCSTIGADVFLTDIGNSFTVQYISNRFKDHFTYSFHANFDALQKKKEIENKAVKLIHKKINVKSLPEKLKKIDDEEDFKKELLWKKLSKNCNNCALCISLCPTCHCCLVIEDIIDMVIDEIGEEAKNFDPCMHNIFISAGLNGGIPSGDQRLHRRVMDKFCHSAKNLGQPFCVGCGRCITNCPEHIDLVSTLETLGKIGIGIVSGPES